MRVQPTWRPESVSLIQKIAQLEQLATARQSWAILEVLREIVPTFQPAGTPSNNGRRASQAPHSENGTLPKFVR
jgi:hypothetical protein